MINQDRIKNVMDIAINSGEEVGASFVLAQNGKKTMEYSCGYADIENNLLMRSDTICSAFSCSKTVTSAAAMLMLERGMIDINDDICRWLVGFSNPHYVRNGKKIPCSRGVKVRDLLNMTSGIPYPGNGEGIEPTNNLWGEQLSRISSGNIMSTVEFANAAGACPLMFDVGNEWMYGASADIMGALIEQASGQKFGDFLKENFFEPLEMNDSAFYVPTSKQNRLAAVYECAGKTPKLYTGQKNLCIYNNGEAPAFESGGAGLFTTAEDFAKFGAMLSNGGSANGKQILGRKTVDFLTANSLTSQQQKTYSWDSNIGFGYANFMRILENPAASGLLASKGSFGWDGWTGTFILCDTTEKTAVVLFLQRAGAGTSRLARAVVNAVFSQL